MTLDENFVTYVDQCAALVRKRDLRKLGESALAARLPALLRKHLSQPLDDCSAVMLGDALLDVFKRAIKSMAPPEAAGDTVQKRHFTYLREFVLDGEEVAAVAARLNVARSMFFEIQRSALENLAATLARWEMEAQMPKPILDNLGRPPYTEYVNRYTADGQDYIRAVVLPKLREGRAWIIAIRGNAGVGKSSLAYAVAQLCQRTGAELMLPFEAVIWIECRSEEYEVGKDTILVHSVPMSMASVYDVIGVTLEKREVLQCSPEEKRQVVQRLLREHVCLLVINNLDSGWVPDAFKKEIEAFVQWLPEPHKALVTMRENEYWSGQVAIDLAGMSDQHLRDFAQQEALARELTPFTEQEFARVAATIHGVPLAAKQVLSLTRIFGYSLDEALAFHQHSPKLLDFMYGKSYERLPVEAKRILNAMPLFVDPASADALEYASGISGPEKVKALGLLYRGQLIEKLIDKAGERYVLLPFAHEFLRKLQSLPEAAVAGTPIATLVHATYQRLAEYFYKVLSNLRDRTDDTLLQIKADQATHSAVLAWAARADPEMFIKLFDLLGVPWGTLRHLQRRLEVGWQVVAACRALGRAEEADWYLIHDVAWALVRMGTAESRAQATGLLAEARERALANGWKRNLALVLRNLGNVALDTNDCDSAENYIHESLRLWDEIGDLRWRMSVRHALANLLRRRGDRAAEAEQLYQHLLTHYTQTQDLNGQILVRAALGLVGVQQGNCEAGRTLSNMSLELAQSIPAPAFAHAYAATRRSELEEACGDRPAAIHWAHEAVRVFDDLGMTFFAEQQRRRGQTLAGPPAG
jgi:hypothetical protein